MKILLDEMWSSTIAEQLRQRGYDVIAVSERRDLRGKRDDLILAAAQREQYVVMTDNVRDFRRYAGAAIRDAKPHAGLIFTSAHRFNRHDPQVIGPIVRALVALLEDDPDLTNQEHWLA